MAASPQQQPLKHYILFDGAQINAPLLVYQNDDAPWIDPLYRGTRHASAIEVSPCLALPSSESRLWENADDWSKHAVILKTEVGPEVLISHLRSLISIRLPSGQLSYCRFYSNRQLPALLSVMDEAEQGAFSGPVREWCNPVSNGHWQNIAITSPNTNRTSADEGWFQLRDEHIVQLNQTKTTEFAKKLSAHLGNQNKRDAINDMQKIIRIAETYGFKSERDIARFAELSLSYQNKINEKACQSILHAPDKTSFEKFQMLDHQLAYGDA
ncbi:DUF4123 domain-containing protein [Marinobacter sp. 1Y8]